MKNLKVKLNKNNILILSGHITFFNIVEVLNYCTKITNNLKKIKIDLKEIYNSNSSIIILIINYIKNAKKKNIYIYFLNIPQAILELIKVYNLASLMSINNK